MGYYNISLTDAAKKACTIIKSFGKYKYNHISMGVYIVPYIFQDRMSALMDDLEFARVYLGDLLVMTLGSFEDHLAKFEEVIKQLQLVGLKYKIDKWNFKVPEEEYLG